jgi:hypothetical protein
VCSNAKRAQLPREARFLALNLADASRISIPREAGEAGHPPHPEARPQENQLGSPLQRAVNPDVFGLGQAGGLGRGSHKQDPASAKIQPWGLAQYFVARTASRNRMDLPFLFYERTLLRLVQPCCLACGASPPAAGQPQPQISQSLVMSSLFLSRAARFVLLMPAAVSFWILMRVFYPPSSELYVVLTRRYRRHCSARSRPG